MIERRFFQKPDGQPINDYVAYVEYDLSGDRIQSYSIDLAGRKKEGSNWRLKDAISLVDSGHWIEITEKMIADIPQSPSALGAVW